MKFRKRPVVIEAIQYTGREEDHPDLVEFFHPAEVEEKTSSPPKLLIRTLEGNMLASVGDWIIRGVQGELYPCRADIFEATYEEVTE